MESDSCTFEELDFTTKCQASVSNQRKILDYYSKSEYDRHKKNRSEVFTKENIQDFLTLLKVDSGKIEFIDSSQLHNELTTFLQGLKCSTHNIGESIQIVQGKFIILFDGCLIKKVQNHFSMNYTLMINTLFTKKNRNSNNQNHRQKIKQSKMASPFITSLKKINQKKIQVDHTSVPKILFYDTMDSKPYQCRTKVTLFQQSELTLQKFQKWVQNKERQGIVSFISYCFGLQDKKIAAKFLSKVRKNYLKNKSEILIEPDTIYLIYKGEVRLTIDGNATILSKNSCIYKQKIQNKFEAMSTSDETLLFIIRVKQIEDLSNEEIIVICNQLKQKLKTNNTLRLELFQGAKTSDQLQQIKEPAFDVSNLKLNYFEKEYQTQKNEKLQLKKKYLVPRPYSSNHSSKRFRVTQPNASAITLTSDMSCLLSNYPYIKTVESEQRAFNILKSAVPPRTRNIKSASSKCVTNEQKRKIEKQIKKLYYNDKVRRLKIKNIASKQIPNGHKKDFNCEKAEQEISQLLLFKNIIEYPIDGVSESASKQSRNKKVIAKLAKMSSINSRVQRKTTGNDYCKRDSIKGSYDVDYLKGSTEKVSDVFAEITNQTDEASQINGCSHYCTNVLNTHLPTQKEIKYRKSSQRQICKQNRLQWTMQTTFNKEDLLKQNFFGSRMKTTI